MPRHTILPWTFLLAFAFQGPFPVAAAPVQFDGAQWIWVTPDPGQSTSGYPAQICYFRSAVDLPERSQVKAADLFMTADNLFTLYVNGQLAGQSSSNPDDWSHAKRFDVAGLLVPGRNVLAVEAVNTAPGPAGLLAKLVVRKAGGQTVLSVTESTWKANEKRVANWQSPAFDDKAWPAAHVVVPYGSGPWGRFAGDLALLPAEAPWPAKRPAPDWQSALHYLASGAPQGIAEEPPAADYPWPDAIAFLGEDCSLYQGVNPGTSWDSLGVTIFTARNSRSYPEHDLPSPLKMGRRLFVLKPAKPGTEPRLLFDAGKGGMGPPAVSFDGRWILLAMVRDGDSFFHVYRIPIEGGAPRQLTDGPFQDLDPAELPDGRIVFTSTRIGTFEEYHSPPSRALFTMNADGSGIRPLTHTFVFDNEPRVMADGRILFIRSDDFFGRGKVETLLHSIHTDGTHGYTEFGLDQGPEYGGRLRSFYCGSPAPMPDGQVAFVTAGGIAVGRPGHPAQEMQNFPVDAGDVTALPDGRLLCTVARRVLAEPAAKRRTRPAQGISYEKICILDPRHPHAGTRPATLTVLYDSDGLQIHSPVGLGPRARPASMPDEVEPKSADKARPTGLLFCQNARFTKNTTAGWPHVRAIRVLASSGLKMRSSHAYIVHAGSEVEELGTVPLAADGSFFIEVPADRGIAFQAVDAEGRSELNEMSWIFVRPGEQRGCVGCHQPRQAAPLTGSPGSALRCRPLKLVGQGRPLRFRGNNAAVTGLMEMQFDRFREVASINRHSETPQPLATASDEVASLIEQLRGDDSGLKVSAAQRLAIFRDRAAAPALAAAMQDAAGSREVRVAAAMALATCGTRESAEPLLAILGDPDPLMAQAAAVALENLTGHRETFDGFAAGEERARQVQAWQAWFHGTTWIAVERELIARLGSDDRDVVRHAAVALGHVGGDAACTALRNCLVQRRDDNPYPEWMKSHNGDGAQFNSLSPANPRTLQAVTRSLGYLKDRQAVPLLAETLFVNSDPSGSNLFLAEACAEALGRIGSPEAESALIRAHAGLKDYFYYVHWYGDHSALYACHASPVHYFIAEGLDAIGSAQAGVIVPHLIRSLPTDPDRALLPCSDDCETVVGRVIRRSGLEAKVTETCLSILGDRQATADKEIREAIATTYQAWGGKPDPENRAAQVLSAVCRDQRFEPRIRVALDRYRSRPAENFVRCFAGGGLPQRLPVKNWVCFFLARTLGNLGDQRSVESLIAVLDQTPAEGAAGRPDPCDPGVLFLHNELTPCYRAAAAWALGRIGDRRATPVLLKVLRDPSGAPDTHYTAAEAIEAIADPAALPEIQSLAESYPEISTRKALRRALGPTAH